MGKFELKFERADTLAITVGTRQVGWRCQDGIIRCLGSDGDRGYPPHVDELYAELGVERGFHEPGDRESRWSVRDLGQRIYEHCQYQLGGDFSAVELLLDNQIISESVAKGLKHIVLLGTNQPDTVIWKYRRMDTLWLARLMKAKIEATWREVEVQVLDPVLNLGNKSLIRKELESSILPVALKDFFESGDEQFVLLLENKGAAPAIAEGLEICVAALVRLCQVINISPEEPVSSFNTSESGSRSACLSSKYSIIAVAEYFWPVERGRVISAWKRGDFQEAQIWLKSHQANYRYLYQLAGYLRSLSNWEISRFLKEKDFENGWLRSKTVSQLATKEQINQWRSQLSQARGHKFIEIWESTLSIQLFLNRGDCTSAFFQFSQTLERFLYIRSESENWINKGYLSSSDNYTGFKSLIDAWLCAEQLPREKSKYKQSTHKLLNKIRKKRNLVVHEAQPISLKEAVAIWQDVSWDISFSSQSLEVVVLEYMIQTFKEVCNSNWAIPEMTLMQSLYQWGLEVLQAEEVSTQLPNS